MLRAALLSLFLPATAFAEIERFALLANDAAIAEVLRELGGFSPDDVVQLEKTDAASVEQALRALDDRMRARVRERGGEALLFIQCSEELPIEELERSATSSVAKYRVRVVGGDRSLIAALLGAADLDRDERVSVREADAFAKKRALRFSYDLGAERDLFLTDFSEKNDRALIELPANRSFVVQAGSEDGPVIAEIDTSTRSRAISVKPGSYFLRSRGTDHLLEGTLETSPGARAVVSEAQLERIEYDRLVRRAGDIDSLSHGPFVGYRGRMSIWAFDQICQGATAGYSFDLEPISLVPTLSLCYASFANSSVEVTTQELELALRALRYFDFPHVSLHLGVGAGAALLHQQFETTGEAPDRLTPAGLASAHFGFDIDLSRGAYLGVDVAGVLFALRREQPSGEIEVEAVPSVAVSIFAGKRW